MIVVKANPDHTEQIVGEAGEPAVPRRAGFPGGGQRKALRPHLGSGALVHHVNQDAVDKVRDARIKHELVYRRGFFERISTRAHNALHEQGVSASTHGGKGRVGAGHLDRRQLIRAESDGGRRPDIGSQTHLAGDLHDASITDHFGDLHGGHIQRVGQRLPHGDVAHEPFAVVVGGVLLSVEFKHGGLVVDRSCRSDERLSAVHGVVEGGCIDEGFEHRTGLAVRQGMVQLALAVVSTANERFDFARAGIQRDQGNLRRRNDLGLLGVGFAGLFILLGQQRIDVFHPGIDGGGGSALNLWVERGVNAIVGVEEVLFGIFFEQMVFDHVNKIGSFAADK